MKKYIEEFIGTFMLTYIACGVAVMTGNIVATSLAFGLVIVVMAYSVCFDSGCHINPAVSFAMFVSGKMEKKEMINYIISQVLGALLGSILLGVTLGSYSALGANSYDTVLPNGSSVTIPIAFVTETILTFIFVSVILGVTRKKEFNNVSGIIIGLALVLVHLIGIKVTGTSVNPARSLAPAILQGGDAIKEVWLFIVAPLLGACLSSVLYKNVLDVKEKIKK